MPATLNGAFPIVPYREPWAAIAWLTKAFGAHPTVLSPSDPSEPFGHAEILVGTGVVMISDTGHADTSAFCLPGPVVVYVVVEDPDALHTRAVAAGAEIVMDLTDQDYGSREFAARDLEGNVWSFGTYSPARTKPVS
jgi:uncharacterized glyoxalase superfamily protein PhnB